MIEIIPGDCRELADMLADFDSMIVDPPYRAHVHDAATSASPKRGTRKRDLGFRHLSHDLRGFIAEAAGKLKRWSVIYSDVESVNVWRHACEARGATYIRPIPWIRWSMPQLSGDRPTTGHEMLTLYWGTQRGRKAWNGPGNLLALRHEDEDAPPLWEITHKCLRGEGKHKTEKPLDQLLDLVSYFSNPGDLVFDPTGGRGTTALACKLLGRDCVVCEIDPEEAEKARARIEAPELSERDEERYRRWKETSEPVIAEVVAYRAGLEAARVERAAAEADRAQALESEADELEAEGIY